MRFGNALILPEIATPARTTSPNHAVYFKSDGNLYTEDAAGIERLASANTGDVPWTPLPFLSSFTQYSGQEICEYRKLGDEVTVHGLAQSPGASATYIGAVPSALAPTANVIRLGQVMTSTGQAPVRIDVQTDGAINLASGGITAGYWVQLDLRWRRP